MKETKCRCCKFSTERFYYWKEQTNSQRVRLRENQRTRDMQKMQVCGTVFHAGNKEDRWACVELRPA